MFNLKHTQSAQTMAIVVSRGQNITVFLCVHYPTHAPKFVKDNSNPALFIHYESLSNSSIYPYPYCVD